jgi:murein DD-endopeptidase MepM/ murein hydrolase activator NlpD
MVQFVGFLFLAFCVVGLLICGIALAVHPTFGAALISLGINPDSSGGLSSINFSLFTKNGKGWSYITQGYGNTPYSYLYIDHWHNGIDIAANYGAPIYSPVANGAGVVFATGDQDDYCPGKAFGKFVVVQDNANHLFLLFAHLGTITVSPGDVIANGTEIGTVGSTGLETGPHLHFSIFEAAGFSVAPAHGCGPYPQGHDVDPTLYLGTTYE